MASRYLSMVLSSRILMCPLLSPGFNLAWCCHLIASFANFGSSDGVLVVSLKGLYDSRWTVLHGLSGNLSIILINFWSSTKGFVFNSSRESLSIRPLSMMSVFPSFPTKDLNCFACFLVSFVYVIVLRYLSSNGSCTLNVHFLPIYEGSNFWF